jgi:hypothetical protein
LQNWPDLWGVSGKLLYGFPTGFFPAGLATDSGLPRGKRGGDTRSGRDAASVAASPGKKSVRPRPASVCLAIIKRPSKRLAVVVLVVVENQQMDKKLKNTTK